MSNDVVVGFQGNGLVGLDGSHLFLHVPTPAHSSPQVLKAIAKKMFIQDVLNCSIYDDLYRSILLQEEATLVNWAIFKRVLPTTSHPAVEFLSLFIKSLF